MGLRRKLKNVLEGNKDDRFTDANARGDKWAAVIDPVRATPVVAAPDRMSWRKRVEKGAPTHAPKS